MSSRFLLKKPYNAQKKVISNLDIEIVPDASHLLPVGKPDYVNQRVSDFINR